MTYKVSPKNKFYGFHPYGDGTIAHYKNVDNDIVAIGEFLDTVNPAILTRTSDSGQYVPGSYTSGMTTGATIGYHMYRFSDGHGDVYLRLNYCVGVGTSSCGYVNVVIGSGTNGSGGFTGWSYTINSALSFPARDTFYNENQYISASVKEGLLAVRLGHNHSLDTDTATIQPATFIMARAVDSLGSYLAGELAFVIGAGFATGVGNVSYASQLRPGYRTINLAVSQVYAEVGCPSGMSYGAAAGDYINVAPIFGAPMGAGNQDKSRYFEVQLPFAVLRDIPDIISCYHCADLGYSITTPGGTFKPTGALKDPVSNFSIAMRIA